MKKTFFKVVYELTISSHVPLKIAILIEILASLQITHIILQTVCLAFDDQKTSVLYALYSASSIIASGITHNSLSKSQIIWIGVIAMIYLVLLLLLILVIFLQLIQKNFVNNCVKRLISNLLVMHSKIFFFSLQLNLFRIINHFAKSDFSNDSSQYYSKFWLIVIIICSVVNTALAATKDFFLYEIGNRKDSFSAQNNFISQLTLLHKLTCLSLQFLGGSNLFIPKVSIILHFFFILWSSFLLHRTVPYYNFKIFKVIIITTGFNLSLSLVSILKAFDRQTLISETLLLALPPLIVKLYFNLFERLFLKIKKGYFDSSQKAVHFANATKELCFRQSDFSILCKKPTNFAVFSYGKFAGKFLPRSRSKDSTQVDFKRELYGYIIEKIERALSKYPNSAALTLKIASIYLRKFQNLSKFQIILDNLKKSNLPLSAQISLERLRAQAFNITLKKQKKENYTLEVLEFFNYKQSHEIIKREIRLEIEKHVEILTQFKEKRISVAQISRLASGIEALSIRINKRYKEETEKASMKFTGFMIIYAIYLHVIKEITYEASQIIKKLRILLELPSIAHPLDTFSEKSAIIVLSLEKEKVGEILDVSPSAQKIFNTKKSQMVGHSMESFLPSIMASSFKLLIARVIQGTISELDSTHNTYAKTSDGVFFEVKAQLKLFPYKNNVLSLLFWLEKVSSPLSIIIINSKGTLIDCSKELRKKLSIERPDVRIVKIDEIFPQLGDHIEAFNDVNIRKKSTVYSMTNDQKGLINGQPYKILRANKPMDSIESLVTKSSDDIYLLSNRNVPNKLKKASFASRVLKTKVYDTEEVHTVMSAFTKQDNENDDIQEPIKQSNSFVEGLSPRYSLIKKIQHAKQAEMFFDIEIKPFCLEGRLYKILVLHQQDQKDLTGKDYKKVKSALNDPQLAELESFADYFPIADENPQNKFDEGEKRKHKTNHTGPNLSDQFNLARKSSNFNANSVPSKLVLFEPQRNQLPQIVSPKNFDQSEIQSVSGVSRNRVVRAAKVLKQAFTKKNLHPMSQFSRVSVYLVMVMISILVLTTFFIARNSKSQISQGLRTVILANERLNLSINIWTRLLIIYSRATDARPNVAVARIFQNFVYRDSLKLIAQNNQLLEKISSIQDQNLIKQMFIKEVSFWRVLDDKKYKKTDLDTFEATQILVNKYINIANFSNLSLLANNSEFLFAINNTANEYWLSTEHLVFETEELLDSIIFENIGTQKSLFFAINFGLFLLLCSLFSLAWINIQTYKRLILALDRVDNSQLLMRISQLEKSKLLLEEDSESQEFINNSIEFLNKGQIINQAKLPNPSITNQKRTNDQNFLGTLFYHLIKYLLISIICIIGISGMFWKSITESISEFESFKVVRNQISLVTNSVCQINFFVGNFYFMILLQDQPTMLVHNTFSRLQANMSLNQLGQMNQLLTSAFFTQIDENDETISTLFNKNICRFLTDNLDLCAKATSQGTIGLLNLIGKNYLNSIFYLEYFNKDPSPANAKIILNSYATAVAADSTTLFEAFKFLSSYVLKDFEAEIDKYSNQRILEVVLILVIIALSTILIEFVSIKKLVSFDAGRRKILNIIPLAFFQNCRLLKSYLIQEFKKEVAEIKDLL